MRAKQAGDQNFIAAPPVERSFFVFSSGNRGDWVSRYFNDSVEIDDLEDLSGDGLPNLLKYAFGLDPHVFNAGALPGPQIDAGVLGFSFTRDTRATDLAYIVEVSNDRMNWTELARSENGEVPTGPGFMSETSGNPLRRVTVADNVSAALEPVGMIRLIVERLR